MSEVSDSPRRCFLLFELTRNVTLEHSGSCCLRSILESSSIVYAQVCFTSPGLNRENDAAVLRVAGSTSCVLAFSQKEISL